MKEMSMKELSNVSGGKTQIYQKRKVGLLYLIDAIIKAAKDSKKSV